MANTEVLLLQPIEGLGAEGDQVKVRAGYARNYLLPRKLAAPLTNANRKHVEALKKRRAEREVNELNGAQDMAKKLEKVSIAFVVKTGEGGKMFGAITATDLHDKLAAEGILLDKRHIHLHTPVKTLGNHEVKIKLHAEVAVDLKFDVVSENPIEVAKEEPAADVRKTEKRSARRKTGEGEAPADEAAEKPARKPRAKKSE